MTAEHEPENDPENEAGRTPRHDLDGLLGAHALDAVDDDERRDVEAHIAGSPSARAEAARLAMAVDALAAAASAHIADPDRPGTEADAVGRAWEHVRAEMPDGRAAGAERLPLPPLQLPNRAPATPEEPAETNVASLDDRRRPRAWMAAVAAAAALVIGVLLGATLTREDPDEQLSLEQLAAEASAGAGSRSGMLSGEGVGEVQAVVAADGSGFLYADALPALPAGRTYQMWSLDGTEPVSLGVLGADPGLVVFPAGTTTTLAITEEPAAGSVAPTGPPVASGMVTSR